MKRLIIFIPFLILVGNGISFAWRAFYPESYREWYYIIAQIYALLWLYFMWHFARLKRFCTYSFVAIYALAALSVLNIIYIFLSLEYYPIYAGIIIFSGLITSIIYAVRRD